MTEQKEVFKQDLSKEEEPGGVFLLKLLFRQQPAWPSQQDMQAVMAKHLGDVEGFWFDEKGAGFAAMQYRAHFKDGELPPQLMLMPSMPFDGAEIDAFQRGQMWDCLEERDEILAACKWQVICTDMLGAGLRPQERAAMDMDFLEAMVELFADCEAVLCLNSGKLLLADDIRGHQIPREDRFIKFAVNVRFFNIQGSGDMLVDTLGMGLLFMPDMQYHFHGMDPNWVVNHAYCIASYMLNNENPIKSGDTVDGIVNGQFNVNLQWPCRYEGALIQPAREVIDVFMNEYAAGARND